MNRKRNKRLLTLRLAEVPLCTDNAAIVGILAERKLLHARPATGLDAEIEPGWALTEGGVVSNR